jgi:hypothetical protein
MSLKEDKGKTAFEVHGQKLAGRYGLITLKPRGPTEHNRLFFRLKSPL